MSDTINDPWASQEVSSSDPWASQTQSSQAIEENSSHNWIQDIQTDGTQDIGFWNFFDTNHLSIEKWVETSLDWVVGNWRDFFQAIRMPVDFTLNAIESIFNSINPWIMMLIFTLIAWQISGKKLALGTFLSLFFIGLAGIWHETMVTLSLVFTSVIFSLTLGIPLGIACAKSDRVASIVRPILDTMQTTPAFVYLIPVVMLFGIGNVPGVVVTVVFALPPLVRLTNLGIRQVPSDLIEAGRSFGADGKQMLFKIQLPVAMPSIMAGINQTLMLSLSMVVIASMIAVGGLGQMVLRGIGRLDMGLASLGGIGIVLLAIILDRLTQSFGKKKKKGADKWYNRAFVGFILNFLKKDNK